MILCEDEILRMSDAKIIKRYGAREGLGIDKVTSLVT
jgi:hypothetical protein